MWGPNKIEDWFKKYLAYLLMKKEKGRRLREEIEFACTTKIQWLTPLDMAALLSELVQHPHTPPLSLPQTAPTLTLLPILFCCCILLYIFLDVGFCQANAISGWNLKLETGNKHYIITLKCHNLYLETLRPTFPRDHGVKTVPPKMLKSFVLWTQLTTMFWR